MEIVKIPATVMLEAMLKKLHLLVKIFRDRSDAVVQAINYIDRSRRRW
jgi:hypothetical protein